MIKFYYFNHETLSPEICLLNHSDFGYLNTNEKGTFIHTQSGKMFDVLVKHDGEFTRPDGNKIVSAFITDEKIIDLRYV